jgi:hypothetical protein
MKTIINHEEMKREWALDHWYEKATYIVGIIFSVIFVISFLVGFISGLLGV